MRQKLIIAVIALLLLTPQAFARVTVIDVTKENQQETGVNFSLNIVKMNDKIYSIQFDARKAGKLEHYRTASLVLYDGEQMILSAPLKEYAEDTDKSITLKFSLDGNLLDKCVLSLMCSDIMLHTSYNIHLVTYLPTSAS